MWDDDDTYTIEENYAAEDERYLKGGRPEDDLNDVGHRLDCDCPICLPELHDPAERLAGLPERRFA